MRELLSILMFFIPKIFFPFPSLPHAQCLLILDFVSPGDIPDTRWQTCFRTQGEKCMVPVLTVVLYSFKLPNKFSANSQQVGTKTPKG